MKYVVLTFCSFFFMTAFASNQTHRVPQFSNKEVNVWQTVIMPRQPLKMHRHKYDRVVIALNSGTLKVISKHERSHLLRLKKGRAYWLTKNRPGKFHADQNISKHPIKVIVIDIK